MSKEDVQKKECTYCREPIAKTARKCKVCGEPFYRLGKALKFVPLLSLAIAAMSTTLAIYERGDRQEAERATVVAKKDTETAQKDTVAALRKLDGAEQANWELAQKLPREPTDEIRNGIIRNFRLPSSSPDEALRQLEEKARAEPENLRIQKNLYMFRALKNPD